MNDGLKASGQGGPGRPFRPTEPNRWWLVGATMRALVNQHSHIPSDAPQVGGAMTRNMYINDKLVGGRITGLGAGTGPRIPATVIHRGRISLYPIGGAPGANSGYSPSTPLYPGPTLAALKDTLGPLGAEAMRWDVDIAKEDLVVIMGDTGGLGLILSSGANSAGIVTQFPKPTVVNANPGYVIVGDGGTGFRFQVVSVLSGAPTVDIPLTWPKPVDQFVRCSFRILSATRSRNQQFRLLLDGSLVFSQDLGDALAPVPDVAGGFRVSWRFVAQGPQVALEEGFMADDTVCWWGDERIWDEGC